MGEIRVIFFRKAGGKVPINDWLDGLSKKDRRKCLERVERLRQGGHGLERPFAAYLRDGIYELRVESGNVNYRMLYFFHGTTSVVLSHGIVKKTQKVSPNEIEKALSSMAEFVADPKSHSYGWEPHHGK